MIITQVYLRCDRCNLVAMLERPEEVPDGWTVLPPSSGQRSTNRRGASKAPKGQPDLCQQCTTRRNRFLSNEVADPTTRTAEEQTLPPPPVPEPEEPTTPEPTTEPTEPPETPPTP